MEKLDEVIESAEDSQTFDPEDMGGWVIESPFVGPWPLLPNLQLREGEDWVDAVARGLRESATKPE